eukprot:m.270636 g.270636  ORF g.270636 m.270636 type:complete len:406 (-) comp11083_c1_seq15:206-1423(-)
MHSIIHADIKPENILLSDDGRPILTDFDTSRDSAADARAIAKTTRAFAFTAAYAAPEVLRCHRATKESDVFSLGVVFSELLLGQQLRDADTLPADGPVELRHLHLLSRMLAAEASDRPSMQEVLASSVFLNQPALSHAVLESLEAARRPPSVWSVRALDILSGTTHFEKFGLPSDKLGLFEELMNAFAQPDTHGTHCQQREVFQRFVVKSVTRVENHALWGRYSEKRAELEQRHEALAHDAALLPLTRDFQGTGDLRRAAGEVYAFHGADKRAAETIALHGFDARVSAAGFFGNGTYFAESASKSDQYAGSGGQTQWMILSRVSLGRQHSFAGTDSQLRRPPCVEAGSDGCDVHARCEHKRFDSIVGCSNYLSQSFREFVIYDNSQAYPEYLIEYRRERSADSSA